MTARTLSPADELQGRLLPPGTDGYDDACTLFNAMIERRPRHVARCRAAHDVVAALGVARRERLPVAVRAGGHSVAGHSLVDDGLVLDVRGLDDVAVDPRKRVVRAGGGATWAQVDRATTRHGLATTGGRVSTTGVAGLTLGGGSGWLERKLGLACDNLIAAELVTAGGEIVRVSEGEHPELLWALRGGGGNFGVVTALELRLHPIGPDLLAGLLLYPAERGAEVLRCLRDLTEDGADDLGLGLIFTTGPDEPEIPAALRGRPVAIVAGTWAGDPEAGEHVLAPLRDCRPAADFFDLVPYADFQCSIDDPPGYRNWWTAEHLRALPDAAIDAIADLARDLPAGGSQLCVLPWGGQIARVGPEQSPLGGRDTAWVVHPLLLWEHAADDDRLIGYGRRCRESVAAWTSGAVYLNFVGDEGPSRVRSGFAPGAYERLLAIKARWDPSNVFTGNQNIRPGTSGSAAAPIPPAPLR